jgi:thioredoxin-dependent peroxiredoxin
VNYFCKLILSFLSSPPAIPNSMNPSRRALLRWLWVCCLTFFVSLSFVPAAAALGGEQPPLNQPAPAFTLPSNAGDGEISLSNYRGKWVVVYFYPKDFTSGCTLEARRFQQDLPKYRAKNTEILGISADDVESHAEFCDSEGLRFPLLADIKGSVSKAYGSWLGYVSLRHTYIIDPEGILRERFVGVNPAIHSAEVLARLEELQQTAS